MEFKLNTYFTHMKLIMSLVDDLASVRLKNTFDSVSRLDNVTRKFLLDKDFTQEAINLIRAKRVRTIEELIMGESLNIGELVTFERTLNFSGLNKAILNREKGIIGYSKFHVKLPEFADLTIKGKFSPEHLTCDSASGKLSGKSKVFMLAHIDAITPGNVELRPIIMADRIIAGQDVFPCSSPLKIAIEDIDEFKKVIPYNNDLNVNEMKQYSEEQIKNWFAKIIMEGNIPKDWGGEYSDLYSTHVHLKGKRLHAAFLFKGPSKFHRMKMTDLGKNGDQIVRLFQEPADIFFLQHCHYISAAIIHTMEAFSSRMYMPKYFCLVDGIDTLRILKGYKKC